MEKVKTYTQQDTHVTIVNGQEILAPSIQAEYTDTELRMLQYIHMQECKYPKGSRAWWKAILRIQGTEYRWWWSKKALKAAGYKALYSYKHLGTETERFTVGGES